MLSPATLEDAIATYNEYRSPMATASLLDATERTFEVRFEGPFCRMCCDYDYFHDLRYELHELGVDANSIDVEDVSYEGGETFRVAFAVES